MKHVHVEGREKEGNWGRDRGMGNEGTAAGKGVGGQKTNALSILL